MGWVKATNIVNWVKSYGLTEGHKYSQLSQEVWAEWRSQIQQNKVCHLSLQRFHSFISMMYRCAILLSFNRQKAIMFSSVCLLTSWDVIFLWCLSNHSIKFHEIWSAVSEKNRERHTWKHSHIFHGDKSISYKLYFRVFVANRFVITENASVSVNNQ